MCYQVDDTDAGQVLDSLSEIRRSEEVGSFSEDLVAQPRRDKVDPDVPGQSELWTKNHSEVFITYNFKT